MNRQLDESFCAHHVLLPFGADSFPRPPEFSRMSFDWECDLIEHNHITQARLCSKEGATQGSVPSWDFFASINLAFASAHIIQHVYTSATVASMWHTLAHIDLRNSRPMSFLTLCLSYCPILHVSLSRSGTFKRFFVSRIPVFV